LLTPDIIASARFHARHRSILISLHPFLNVLEIEVQHPGGEFIDLTHGSLILVIVVPVVVILVHVRVLLFEEFAQIL
jgi:hypothetical protein